MEARVDTGCSLEIGSRMKTVVVANAGNTENQEKPMKTIFTVLVAGIVMAGCGKGGNEDGGSGMEKAAGMFTGAVAGNEYRVEVNCSYIDKDYFQFKSDKTDITDTNGDGLIITGMETGGKFSLTINDNGKTFSVGNLANFSKGNNKAEGSGQLFEEGTSAAHDVRFSVVCP